MAGRDDDGQNDYESEEDCQGRFYYFVIQKRNDPAVGEGHSELST